MGTIDVRTAWEKTAREIKSISRCPTHGTYADYKITGSSNEPSVSWSCCCQEQKTIVTSKFTNASSKYVAEAGKKYIEDEMRKIFKR